MLVGGILSPQKRLYMVRTARQGIVEERQNRALLKVADFCPPLAFSLNLTPCWQLEMDVGAHRVPQFLFLMQSHWQHCFSCFSPSLCLFSWPAAEDRDGHWLAGTGRVQALTLSLRPVVL